MSGYSSVFTVKTDGRVIRPHELSTLSPLALRTKAKDVTPMPFASAATASATSAVDRRSLAEPASARPRGCMTCESKLPKVPDCWLTE